MANHHEVDDVTGIHTTGHVWDGDLKELNRPLPRWWLWTFYVSIVWSIGYCIVYPAIPTLAGYTPGIWGYSQRAAAMKEVADNKASQAKFVTQIEKANFAEIRGKTDLFEFARVGGASAFKENCAACHGMGAQGAVGYPNLNDDDWLWGGKLEDIQKTLEVGIRSGHKQARETAMPRFGLDKLLNDAQVNDAAEYVLSLSKKSTDAAAAERGSKVYAEQCASCHKPDGKGDIAQGAPNLTDGIWLYGSKKTDVVESIRTGRGGVMPAWQGRLDPATIKMLAVYVHALGGGKQ